MKYNNAQITIAINRLQYWWDNNAIIDDLTKIIDKHLLIKDSKTQIIENYTNFKNLELVKGVILSELNGWIMFNEWDEQDIKNDSAILNQLKTDLVEFLTETIRYGYLEQIGIELA